MNENVYPIIAQPNVIELPPHCHDLLGELRKTGHWPTMANVECEAAFLGALMIDNKIHNQTSWLDADAFFEPVYGRIYRRMIAMIAEGAVANIVTLRPFFEHDPAIIQLGGLGYLAHFTGNSMVLVGAVDFARQLRELHQRRQLFEAVIDVARAAYDSSEKGHQALPKVIEQLDEALMTSIAPEATKTNVALTRAWDAAMKNHDDMADGKARPGIYVDGLDDFNQLLRGLRAGNLIVIAGRPGMGKTATAVTIASCCARAGHATGFFSLEMSTEELIERQITDICFEYNRSFTYEDLQEGRLKAYHRKQVDKVRAEIADWPLYYDDEAGIKVGHLIGKMRRLKRQCAAKGTPLKVVVVDYLQLLKSDHDYKGNKVNEVTEISGALKSAAKQLGLSVILLSQLNRGVEQRENKRPVLSDLRDSGSIEQDADAVIFLYREEYYLQQSEPPRGNDSKSIGIWEAWDFAMRASRDRIELIAAKVRKGKTGSRKCYFFGAYQAVRGSKFLSEAI